MEGMTGLHRAVASEAVRVWDGKTYRQTPLDAEDFGTCELHLRGMQKNAMDAIRPAVIKLRKDAATLRQEARDLGKSNQELSKDKLFEADLLDAEAEKLRQDAFADLKKDRDLAKLDMAKVLDWIQSYNGVVFSMYLTLRRHHPEIDLGAAKELVEKIGLEEAVMSIWSVSGIDEEGNSTGLAEDAAKTTGPKLAKPTTEEVPEKVEKTKSTQKLEPEVAKAG